MIPTILIIACIGVLILIPILIKNTEGPEKILTIIAGVLSVMGVFIVLIDAL